MAPQAFQAPVFDERESVGLDVHARSVVACGLDTVTGSCTGPVPVMPDPVTVEQIRAEDEYSGLRVRFEARLHTARMHLALDVSAGDPIHPAREQVVLSGLLGHDVTLRGPRRKLLSLKNR